MSMLTISQPQRKLGFLLRGHPLRSVRGGLVAGFGLLTVILVGVVAGSAWLVSEYKSDTVAMEQHTNSAALLQQVESNMGVAALLIQRYVVVGDEEGVAEIQAAAGAVARDLETARNLEAARGDNPEQLAVLDQIYASGTSLVQAAGQMVALRQSGQQGESLALMENAVVPFTEFRLALDQAAATETAKVTELQHQAAETGNLAFWLLVISGVSGVLLGALVSGLITRSIIRPLSSLEATAVTASGGDLTVRAPASGPRELARVGHALNQMMATVEERTDDLRLSNEELRERNQQLMEARAQAASDPLTGLLNHRKFHEKVRALIDTAQAGSDDVGLIMLDVDNFKKVNDTLGHQKGDELLRNLASTIASIVQPENSYRYGGDEFAILLPGSGDGAASETARRLLDSIQQNGEDITVSLGVATFPDMAGTAEELIYRADMAMNWAKSAGKNQIADWASLAGGKIAAS